VRATQALVISRTCNLNHLPKTENQRKELRLVGARMIYCPHLMIWVLKMRPCHLWIAFRQIMASASQAPMISRIWPLNHLIQTLKQRKRLRLVGARMMYCPHLMIWVLKMRPCHLWIAFRQIMVSLSQVQPTTKMKTGMLSMK